MGISKAQAAALAEGFLDDIGTEETFQPRETFTDLILMAGELVEDAQDNLNKSNTNASGGLSESLEASEPEKSGSTLKVDVYMNFYGRFVNKGVKGTKSGAGLYAFKYDMPSKSMVDAIKEYIKSAGKKTRNVNARKTISKNEIKNASISSQIAFATARSIKQHGIKATGFLDKAVEVTRKKVKGRLELDLRIDVLDSIIK